MSDRTKARVEVVAAANRVRLAKGVNQRPYLMRHLQQAVCVVRRSPKLAKAPRGLLLTAGFREDPK